MEQGDSKLLQMRRVTKAYSGVKALDDVNFDLHSGEVHALVGENGAGKSTLVKILTAVVQKDSGRITIDGREVHIRNAHHARQLGIATIFQELSQVRSLTVAENVFLGSELRKSGFLLDRTAMVKYTQQILDKYNIDLDPMAELSSLPLARRQMAEIVKAVSQKPRILIMDEPTSALTEAEAEIVFKIIKDFTNSGAGVIYVSHRMDEIFRIAQRVTVLRDGKLIDCCNIEKLDLPRVVNLMVGREVQLYESSLKLQAPKEKKLKMQVKNLTGRGRFSDVSFGLYEGEILGIAGLVGSGRSELARAIFGIDKIDSGQIIIDERPVEISSVKDALELGIALLPESRHAEGLVLGHSVQQNMTLAVLKKLRRWGLINYNRARQLAEEKIEQLDIKPAEPRRIVNFLSGGNQQKVVISKWLLTEPKILIVDEPTAGIDVHSKSQIHRLIRKLAQKGVSVIMISSEMPELLAHSDRIMVMNQGRVLGIFYDASQEMIMSLIMQDIMKSKNACMNQTIEKNLK